MLLGWAVENALVSLEGFCVLGFGVWQVWLLGLWDVNMSRLFATSWTR